MKRAALVAGVSLAALVCAGPTAVRAAPPAADFWWGGGAAPRAALGDARAAPEKNASDKPATDKPATTDKPARSAPKAVRAEPRGDAAVDRARDHFATTGRAPGGEPDFDAEPAAKPKPERASDRPPEPAPARKPAKKTERKDAARELDSIPSVPKGQLHIVVSIARQQATLFADGAAVTSVHISSGTPGHPTPMGVFSILQKSRHHVSNLYDAKMPYMQRITWSGSALHEGPLPGYPASHGCVRLPTHFAQLLWKATKIGARVIITRDEAVPRPIEHANLFVIKPKPVEMSRHSDAAPVRPVALVKTADATHSVPVSMPVSAAPVSAPPRPVVPSEPLAVVAPPAASKPLSAQPARSAHASEQPTKLPLHEDADELSMPDRPRVAAPAASPAEPVKRIETPVASKPVEAPVTVKPAEAPPVAARIEIPAPIIVDERPTASVPPVAVTPPPAPVRKGTVSVFVSLKDSKLYVRQGMEPLFESPVTIERPGQPIGTHVYTAMGAKLDGEGMRWTVVSIPSSYKRAPETRTSDRKKPREDHRVKAAEDTPSPVLSPSEALDRIAMPPATVERIAALVTPGASLIVSDNKLSEETGSTTDFIVETR